MDCSICNPEIDYENHCEFHRYELNPLCEYMAIATGCSFYTHQNDPFMALDPDHANLIKAFIAGARLKLELIEINNTNTFRLTQAKSIYFDYITMEEVERMPK